MNEPSEQTSTPAPELPSEQRAIKPEKDAATELSEETLDGVSGGVKIDFSEVALKSLSWSG